MPGTASFLRGFQSPSRGLTHRAGYSHCARRCSTTIDKRARAGFVGFLFGSPRLPRGLSSPRLVAFCLPKHRGAICMSGRLLQINLIVSLALVSWLGMQAVHEFGHVVGAWCTGGKVARVILYPTEISRTDLARNPRPLAVAWAGPIFGALAPLLVWIAVAGWRRDALYLWRFFAGFCLIANGAYIGGGSLYRAGDARDMLRLGAPIWQLWLFGGACLVAGLLLWNRLGAHFGLGTARGKVSGARIAGFPCRVDRRGGHRNSRGQQVICCANRKRSAMARETARRFAPRSDSRGRRQANRLTEHVAPFGVAEATFFQEGGASSAVAQACPLGTANSCRVRATVVS